MKWNNLHSQLHEEIQGIQGLIDEVDSEVFIIETEMPQDRKVPAISRFLKRIRLIKNLVETVSTKVDVIDCILADIRALPTDLPEQQEPEDFPKQVHDLQITYLESGSASVSINDLVPFQVSAMMGHLLNALAIDTKDTNALYPDDPLVPFKSYDEIILHMVQFGGGGQYTKAGIRTGVYRLRQAMAEQGFAGLIQTNRRLQAYRFALRRRTSSPRAA